MVKEGCLGRVALGPTGWTARPTKPKFPNSF